MKTAKIFYFSESMLEACPFQQFQKWYLDALQVQEISYPHAFTLSTLNSRGYPEGRVVLLKDFSDKGLVFYTNSLSNKGRSLCVYPKAGASFYWDPLGRQVRILGAVEKVSDEEADAYYETRSVESRIGAWASDQSFPISNREELLQKIESLRLRFEREELRRPPHWTGYRIKPIEFEYWLFGNDRIHDRFVYSRSTLGGWTINRLQP